MGVDGVELTAGDELPPAAVEAALPPFSPFAFFFLPLDGVSPTNYTSF